MPTYLGDFRIAKTVRKLFNTNEASGESIYLGSGTGTASDGEVRVYKDGGVVQSTTGVTLTENFDGLTGVHLVAIDTSADGTFYSAGSEFDVVLAGAIIDSLAINAALFSFSLENRSALMPTTDGRKLTIESDGMGHADVKEWLGVAPLALSSQQVQAVVPNTQKVDVNTIKTQAVTASAGVTVGAFVGQATAAIGVNASGHVSRVVLVDTTTTNTDMLSVAAVNAEMVDVISTDTLIDGKSIEAALEYIAAICAGKVSGAGTGTEVFKGLSGSTRVTVTVDANGNRTDVVYS